MNELPRPDTMSGLKVVLAATDFSARSDRAVRRAAALARQSGAGLVIAHVVDDDQPEHIVTVEVELAESALADAIREHTYLAGLDCRPLVILGTPFDGIVRAAQQESADLCVVGSHRRLFLRDIFVGTTAERVIRNSTVPVLMANLDPALPYAKSLAPVELTDCSAQALETGRRLGLLQRTKLIVMHVYDAAAAGMLNYAGVDKTSLDDYLVDTRTDAVRDLVRFLEPLRLDDIDYSTVVREGVGLATDIIEAATELRPDLVVIGTHARRGAVRLLLSSVTEEVLRQLQRDILVVPVRDAAG
ncbi:universal stress protein [Rhodopseudomonas sp. WA056]|uniref:universal stress protein n=1 Tax=Rhodopseudomonas sp. WA056 TaxID=2269367 RepID=UPI0013DF5C70|nr:universal stress protein [Rhodopseudomonas sp. WA056]NEW87206.1 universal stress protein [Rhodopseudomonas sp. WA056]